MNSVMRVLVSAVGISALYGTVRGVKWVIDDMNSYLEQCRLDEIDARLAKDGLCRDCGKPNDRKDAKWNELPELCSKCL